MSWLCSLWWGEYIITFIVEVDLWLLMYVYLLITVWLLECWAHCLSSFSATTYYLFAVISELTNSFNWSKLLQLVVQIVTWFFPTQLNNRICVFAFSRFLYPLIVSMIIATLMYPPFTGQIFGSHLSTHDQFTQLFSNFTWGRTDLTVEEDTIVNNWRSAYSNIYVNLASHFGFNVSVC